MLADTMSGILKQEVFMKRLRFLVATGFFIVLAAIASVASAAYQHAGDAEKDAKYFLNVYPDKAGTKLDNCVLCHSGGTKGPITYDTCRWCHYKYGYTAPHGDITATLNSYGKDYSANGRSEAALKAIESLDSDGDSYSNITEIKAIRYPGEKNDDPTKVVASFRIYNKAQLKAMPQHKQFMLMNTSKSGDYYAEYSGVIMQDLLKTAGIAADANYITVYAADGFTQRHPLNDSSSNSGTSYLPYVNGTYPSAAYYYNVEADKAKTSYGWCNYSSAGNKGRNNYDPISVDGGLRFLLALQQDGKDLVPGYLDAAKRLASGTEGPFRTITPQKIVGPPDQASTATNQSVIWPYDTNADHNAGFSAKCATMIRVEPLPAGTTDVNFLEAGWGYIDQAKIVIYGALQGPTLVSPADGTMNVVRNGAILTWAKTPDPDPAAAVTYTIELSKDQVTWTTLTTQVASVTKSGKTFFAGAGKFLFFGIFGMIAVGGPRRTRKYLGIFLLIAATGAVISSCGGDGGGTPSTTASTVVTQTLDPNTTFFWRVTADGPNSHTVSDVSSFTTAAP